MNNKLKVSVIIITKNRYKKIISCLDALLQNTYQDFKLIIVDQSNQKKSNKELKQKLSLFQNKIYLKQKQAGKSKGLNLAIKNSFSPILAFTDDDCIPGVDWVENIVQSFKTKKNIVAVFGRTLPYQPTQNKNLHCPSTFNQLEPKLISQPCKHWKNIGFGNNMSWKKEFFTDFGLFKEWLGPGSIGSNAEDAEMTLRALRNKKMIFYNPNVTTYHNKWLNKQQLKKQFFSYKQGEIFCYGYLALLGEKIGWEVIKNNLLLYFSKFKIAHKLKSINLKK